MKNFIITILFFTFFTYARVYSQGSSETLSFEFDDDKFVDVISYEYDQTKNYLTLQCIFKKYTGSEFSNLKESIYLKSNNKKIFPSYFTPFLEIKQSAISSNIVEGILIFKINGKWDRKIYSDYTGNINLNEYKLKNVLAQQYGIENLYFKIKEEIKHKNNENIIKYFQIIRNDFSDIYHSNFLPIKYEVLGDSIFLFNEYRTFRDTLDIINFYSLAYHYGNRDTIFLHQYFNILFNISNNFYYYADDEKHKSYYDSSKIYFEKINEKYKGGDIYNETLYKEIYSLYKILINDVDFTIAGFNELFNLIKVLEEWEKTLDKFEYTYKAKILLGNYYYYLSNTQEATKIYKSVIDVTNGKNEYSIINITAKEFLEQIKE